MSLQVQKRIRAVEAIRGLHAHALYLRSVSDGLCAPVYEPDPEDLEHFSKRAWEGAVQSWRRGIEAGAQCEPLPPCTDTHTHTGTHIQRRRACLRVQIQIGGSAFPQGGELGTARPVPRAPGIPDSFPRRRRCRKHDLAESDKPEIVLNVSARPCLWAPRCAAVQSMLTAHDVVASRSGGWRPD